MHLVQRVRRFAAALAGLAAAGAALLAATVAVLLDRAQATRRKAITAAALATGLVIPALAVTGGAGVAASSTGAAAASISPARTGTGLQRPVAPPPRAPRAGPSWPGAVTRSERSATAPRPTATSRSGCTCLRAPR